MLDRTRRLVPVLFIVLPVAIQALVVRTFGVNTVLVDEFFYVPFVKRVIDGDHWIDWLTVQHNEHWMIPTKILMALLARPTAWNAKALMYVSVLLAGLIVLGFWRVYKRAGGTSAWRFVPVAWLICGLGGFENMLYGLQVGFYFTALGVVWALERLGNRSRYSLLAAVGFGVLASSSTMNGLLVWPIGLALVVVTGERLQSKVLWAAAAVAVTSLYFVHYSQPSESGASIPRSVATLLQIAAYAVTSLGAPIGAANQLWSVTVGASIVVTSTIVLRMYRRDRAGFQAVAALVGVVLFGLLSTTLIAVGRNSLHAPLQSRYVIFSSFAMAGLYLLLSRRKESGQISDRSMAVASAVLVAGLVVTDVFALDAARVWRADRLREQFLLQTIDRQGDQVLASLFFSNLIRPYAADLQRARLGPYAEPQQLLLLAEWRDGSLGREIASADAIEQRFSCPVETLWDVSVPVAIVRAGTQTILEASVWQHDRLLGARSPSFALSTLHDSSWLSVPLDRPLTACKGQELVLRIRPAASAPGSGAAVWTFPVYFEGELRQGGQAIPNRSVGLALNGIRFDVL